MRKYVVTLMMFILSLSTHAQTKATETLFRAIEKNDSILASNSINAGGDVNGIDDMKNPSTTVLLKAIELKRHEIIKILLSQNADVNQRRPTDFKTGLMLASEMNDGEIVSILLKNGADVNLETLSGKTALHLASQNNSIEAAKLLLKSRELDVNVGGEKCALYLAAKSGHVGMILILKKQSGAKATGPVCIEKAKEIAEKNHKEDVLRILRRD